MASTDLSQSAGYGPGPGLSSAIAIIAGDEERERIATVLEERGLRPAAQLDEPGAIAALDLDAAAIVVFACDVDAPREMVELRRLCRDVQPPATVVVSPPVTGTGVRRALDAGADAVVFDTELELTLAATIYAVASGQSVVPRKLRASVERPNLSHRELQVLELVGQGLTNAEIADRLFLAESTVKSHLASVFTKFGVRSRKEAVTVFADLERAPRSAPAAALPGTLEQTTA